VLRRALAALLCGCAFASSLAAGGQPGGSEAPEVVVDKRNGSYFGSVRLRVPVRPALALAVLTDFEHMADFIPNLTSSRVTYRSGNVYRVTQEGKAEFGPLSYRFNSERWIEVFPDGRVLSRALSGTVKDMHSELQLQAAGPAATLIDYRIETTPPFWLPSALGTSFMEHELEEQFTAIAQEMLRRERLGSR
jgi:carbon monoxide dehydrogenase subunit G